MNVLEKNVVERLRNRVREAKQAGFRVRMEYLEDETATWCVIGGVKTIFIDLSQSAAEQLGQWVDELLERYRPLIWSIVRGRVPYQSAEDVVQEVLIQLWESADRYDPELGSETALIGTVARRRLVDRQRRDERRSGHEAIPEEVPSERDDYEHVDVRDGADRAEAALTRIRPEEQKVLRMSISGLSHREIARRTQAPLGTVKSQVRRGLERVRRLLEDEGEDAQ